MNRKGFASLIILIVVAILVIGGIWYYKAEDQNASSPIPATVPAVGPIVVTYPKAGEHWQQGQSVTVAWEATGSIANVDIALMGVLTPPCISGTCPNVPAIAPPSAVIAKNVSDSGTYTWLVSNVDDLGRTIVSGNYILLITQSGNANVYGESSGPFTVTVSPPQSPITIISPDKGAQWTIGGEGNIAWHSMLGTTSTVSIYLMPTPIVNGNTVQQSAGFLIASNIRDSGSYSWTIPASIAITNPAGIKNESITPGSYSIDIVPKDGPSAESKTLTIVR